MEKAIKRAIKQGWTPITHECYDWRNEEPTNFATKEEVCLDPLFWQALGKEEGWDIYAVCRKHCKSDCYRVNCFDGYSAEWLYRQHELLDHIATGGDIDSFFEELLKN